MPIHFVDGGLESLSSEQTAELGATRAAILEPAYDEYLISKNLRETIPPPSFIQLLPVSDISVRLTRLEGSKTATDLHISNLSDPDADNFMGYSPEEGCLVFKGEVGLFDRFVEFAESVAQDKGVTAVFKTLDEIRIPHEGLEYGLSYEDFAARVEILECAMWIRVPQRHGSVDPGEHGGSQLRVASQSSHPSTPERGFTSNESITTSLRRSDLEDFVARSKAAESSSPLSDISSSLSPPPDEITTPPSLRHLSIWARTSPYSDIVKTPEKDAKSEGKKRKSPRTWRDGKRKSNRLKEL
ncbi:hypothetical protein FZEAL_2628 [Fusarium zealandicum]|uniref:Uncharacterized protein n=1 Tax=Fusarium zealandicum TaxID=1053134 RepID=A0A8H4UQD1_9HYPO|nr:hypothetical protein FZEAL_2628 [Fusarium zealandicum]